MAFLAAETAAHAAGFDPHGGHRQVQGVGDFVLNLGRVLGGGIDVHAVFLRHRGGDLAFEVEVFLAADLHRAFDDLGGGGDGAGGVAFGPDDRALFKAGVGFEGVIDGQQGGEVGVGDLPQAGGFAGVEVACRR